MCQKNPNDLLYVFITYLLHKMNEDKYIKIFAPEHVHYVHIRVTLLVCFVFFRLPFH